MNLLKHICYLLYRHDCVIIPGFGAFITQKTSCYLKRQGSDFLFPPSKKISFNSSIKNNDGLLASHIVKKEGLTYSESLLAIELAISKWMEGLSSHQSLTLEGIGTFTFLEKENNLLFSSDLKANYLMNSFGLHAIKIEEIPFIEKGKNNWRYIAALFFIFFIGLRYPNETTNHSLGGVFHSVIPSSFTKKPLLKKNLFVFSKKIKQTSLPAPFISLNKEALEPSHLDLNDFHIIAGIFRSKKRASAFCKRLEKKDFKVILYYKNQETFISLGDYPNYLLAKKKLDQINKSHKFEDQPWIKKMKF